MKFLQRLAQNIWFWRITGAFGLLFMLTWLVFSGALLVDVLFTGQAEWGPWATQEAASRGEYIAGYVIATVLGLVGLIFMVRWIRPFLKEPV